MREGQLERFLRKLNKQQTLTDKVYNVIYRNGSQAARIYGQRKLHKTCDDSHTPPLRPVVSSIWAFNCNFAKYLSSILTPFIPQKYCVSDSFLFVQEIKNLNSKKKFLVWFDVCSLFANIKLDDASGLAVDLIMKNNILNINGADLKKLFSFTTLLTQFLFNRNLYEQVGGVAMKSPLAPVLVNPFMSDHEQDWLQQYGHNKPEYYRRYVYDTFCVMKNEQDANNFFEYLNTRHPWITLAMETSWRKISYF